mmetsp:Transcript_4508/g.9087  ORF Transcript_4508/g.9087 Transcript_4508/m.9087 type:complete len:274 (+) Transcript_4508:3592-4413(+)
MTANSPSLPQNPLELPLAGQGLPIPKKPALPLKDEQVNKPAEHLLPGMGWSSVTKLAPLDGVGSEKTIDLPDVNAGDEVDARLGIVSREEHPVAVKVYINGVNVPVYVPRLSVHSHVLKKRSDHLRVSSLPANLAALVLLLDRSLCVLHIDHGRKEVQGVPSGQNFRLPTSRPQHGGVLDDTRDPCVKIGKQRVSGVANLANRRPVLVREILLKDDEVLLGNAALVNVGNLLLQRLVVRQRSPARLPAHTRDILVRVPEPCLGREDNDAGLQN